MVEPKKYAQIDIRVPAQPNSLLAKALAVISIATLLDVVLFRTPLIESAAHAGTIISDSITSSSDVMQARFF